MTAACGSPQRESRWQTRSASRLQSCSNTAHASRRERPGDSPGINRQLGTGLRLYRIGACPPPHTLIVRELPGSGVEISLTGEGAESLPCNETNPVLVAMSSVFEETEYRPGLLRVESDNRIPLARGLGSSAAATLAGLAAATALAGAEVERGEIACAGFSTGGTRRQRLCQSFRRFLCDRSRRGCAGFRATPRPPWIGSGGSHPGLRTGDEPVPSCIAPPQLPLMTPWPTRPGSPFSSHRSRPGKSSCWPVRCTTSCTNRTGSGLFPGCSRCATQPWRPEPWEQL